MALSTKLTGRLGIGQPILLAPMDGSACIVAEAEAALARRFD